MKIYRIGSIRLVKKFFILKKVNGETRFLQIGIWEEKYVHHYLASHYDYCTWEPQRWLTNKEYEEYEMQK